MGAFNDLARNTTLAPNGRYIAKSKVKEDALLASTQIWKGGLIITIDYEGVQYVKITDGKSKFSDLARVGEGTGPGGDVGGVQYTSAEKSKLSGIAAGATANSTDANLKNRTNHTGTQPSTTISDFTEAVQDAVAGLLGAGSNVILTYNDATNSLSISATGAGGTGLDAEQVRDAIGVAMVGIGNIAVTVNDAADTITITTTATQNSTDAALRDRSTHTGTQTLETIVETAGLKILTAAERIKLAGIAAGATVNDTDANLRNRTNHTGTQTADTITDGTTNKTYTATEKTKLSGVATGATANSTDAQLRDRSTHTGTQSVATLSDFTEAVQDAVASLLGAGSNITLNYNDAANTLSITAVGDGTGMDPEAVRDAIGVALVGVGNIAITVNDALDTITISTTATQNSTDAQLRDRSLHTGTQTAATISDFQATVDANATLAALQAQIITLQNESFINALIF